MSQDTPADELVFPEYALSHHVEDYEKLARQSVSSGQLLTAIEIARDGLARFGESRTLKQVLALALAQTGALDAARAALDDVLKDAADDVETLSLIGRVYKELWRGAASREDAESALRQSGKYYGDAFTRQEGYYPGINLAFTYAALGEREKARACATKVAKLCQHIVSKAEGSAFSRIREAFGQPQLKPDAATYGWALATLGEAMLLAGDHDEAGTYYRRAADLFAGRWRDLASMRRQAHEILGLSGQPTDWLDRCFSLPAVVAFAGHMIDRPGRPEPRFPAEREPELREAIRRHLDQINAGFGYSSVASGSDIIFCECLLNREAKVNLVLPTTVDAFKRLSVSPAGPDWERRFHHVLANATNVFFANPAEFTISDDNASSSIGFVFANRIVTGLAALQARALTLDLKTLVVWDGHAGDGPGGTATVVDRWKQHGRPPHIISSRPAASAVVASGATASEAPKASAPVSPGHAIQAMVFLEVANHQRLTEPQITRLVQSLRAPLAQMLAALPNRPLTIESAGANLTFVFDRLSDAAQLALELRDYLRKAGPPDRGAPPELAVRTYLHAAPVYVYADPLTQQTQYSGTHMTRAARIAHTTPAGQIYVSQEFAALCGEEGLEAVSLEYLGPLPTSQLFNDTPLYRLHRAPVKRAGR